MDSIWLHGALAAAGIGAGFLNTMAGGGSMLTLPVLVLLGLPADMANGTNRLSVLSQSIAGVIGFRRHGKLDHSAIGPVLAMTVIGAAIGAVAASQVPADVLGYVLLGTMMTMATVMAVAPRAFSAPEGSEVRSGGRWRWGLLALLGAGLYGGFVQAGVGFLLLSALAGVLRYDLVRANALKLTCVACFGAVALGVFVAAGQVVWVPAALLAVYTVVGSMLGVKFALRVPQAVLRWIVLGAVVATCIAALVRA